MKSHNNLYNSIITFPNLLLASKKARKGKRFIHSTAVFEMELETNLLELQRQLAGGTYLPSGYTGFYVYEPKKRYISAAPYHDRVVHHAICNVVEPIFDARFVPDSYANRKGKGTHKAISRFRKLSQGYKYVLKCDIKNFFPSIDHGILKSIIHKTIRCKKTTAVINLIIDSSNVQEPCNYYFPGDNLFTPFERKKGLPIGNLTSQLFGNVYLNALDYFIKNKLLAAGYVRYVDDFAVFSNEKAQLVAWKKEIIFFLEKLRLLLNADKSQIYKTETGVQFLGFKVFPKFLLLRRKNVLRIKKRLKKLRNQLASGGITAEVCTRKINGWVAHAAFGCTYRLRQSLLADFPHYKGANS